MGALFSNNASSTLANALDTTATSLAVVPGDGVLFPTLGAGDWFMATLAKLVDGLPQIEIVKVTARAGDVMTVARAQEGTTALAFVAGDKIDLRITAAGINSKMDKDGGTFSGPVTFDDPVTINDDVTLADKKVAGGVQVDWGLTFFDNAANNTIDYRNGHRQRWAPAAGAQTLTITDWPPVPLWGELMLKVVDGGTRTLTASSPIKWLKSDGTTTTSTSINANHGATLQNTGVDRIALWQEEDGSIYGKVLR